MLLHDVTRCFRREFKNPIKLDFFEHPLARCKKHPKLEEVVPLFSTKRRHFKILKTPYFYSVSRIPKKLRGGHFLQNRPMLKEETFKEQRE